MPIDLTDEDRAAIEKLQRAIAGPWTASQICVEQGYVAGLAAGRARAIEEVEQKIANTAYADGPEVSIRIEQEPGSSGKGYIDHFARNVVSGYDFSGERPTGDKITRARPFAAAAANGNVRLVSGPWISDWLDELSSFPEASPHDDQLDSSVGAFSFLTGLGGQIRRKAAIII